MSRATMAGIGVFEATTDGLQHAGDGLREFHALLTDDERDVSIERFLVTLVRVVRADDDRPASRRGVLKASRRRRRRLGLASLGAGPLSGVAGQLVELYCDVATVCDLGEFHCIGLDDVELAAHMLVLWSIADSYEEARGAIDGDAERTVAVIVAERLRDHASDRLPGTITGVGAVKALWDARGIMGTVRLRLGRRAFKNVTFNRRRTKRFVKRVERHLGVR